MRVLVTQPRFRPADGGSIVRRMARAIEASRLEPGPEDLLALPELAGGEGLASAYEADVSWLARTLGLHVVGGSHHGRSAGRLINHGLVADPSGAVVAEYQKAKPYAGERHTVAEGAGAARLHIGGVAVQVMICADFWYPQTFHHEAFEPDLVVAPAFSVSQRPSPQLARARWRHAAIARAYELPAFVAISDWAHPIRHEQGPSSGVAGLAHPNPARPADLFQPVGRRTVRAYDLDLAALADLRENRRAREFLTRASA